MPRTMTHARADEKRIFHFQKETPSDIQLHLAAIHGDALLLAKLLDSGRVHVDCKDEVSLHNLRECT